jgi:hypothetical protein
VESEVQAEPVPILVADGTLSVFADLAREGIAIQSLPAGTAVTVVTRHSEYRLQVIDPEQLTMSIRGGRMFPESTPAHLLGSTGGGSALKIGWLGVGLQMEIKVGRRVFLTSPVKSIAIDDQPVSAH